MRLFDKIKADLDQKRTSEQTSGGEKLSDNFSVKSILDGRILVHRGFRKILPLIVLLFVLSLVYIDNRFEYEALVKTNNELKETKLDLQTIGLVKISQYKRVATRSAVIKRLAEMGSPVAEPQSPPIVVR